MAVAHRGSAAASTNNPTTSFSITIPASVQAGDDLYVAATSRDHTSGTALATCTDNDTGGNTWTLKHNPADRKTYVWWKKATSATASKTITVAGCVGSSAGGVIAVSGGRGGDPTFDIVTESNGPGDESHASFTPTNADSYVMMAIYNVANDETVSNSTWATLGTPDASAGWQKLSTGGSDCGSALVGKAQVGGPSATGAFTWSQNNNTVRTTQWTVAPFEAKTGTVTATGGGVATLTAASPRTATVTATGGGVATVTQKTVRTATIAATGGGIATVTQKTSRVATVTATGGGVATVSGVQMGPALTGSVSATGGGTASVSHAAAHNGVLSGSGGGVAFVSAVGARLGAATGSGGGAASVTASSSRVAETTASGGGSCSASGVKTTTASVGGTGAGTAAIVGAKRATSSVTATGGGEVTVTYLVGQTNVTGSVSATGGGTATVSGAKAALTSVSATASGGATVGWVAAHVGVVVATGGGVAVLEVFADAPDIINDIGEILDVPGDVAAAWFYVERHDPTDVNLLATAATESLLLGNRRRARRLSQAAELLAEMFGGEEPVPEGEVNDQVQRTSRGSRVRVSPRI